MLSPEQWEAVEHLFARCSAMSAADRVVFLERAPLDQDVRREVASLLQHEGDGIPAVDSAIASMAAAVVAGPPDQPDGDPLVGSWLGPYRITGLLGRGGMGAVYRAVREDDQFRKQVAIKIVPRVLAGPESVARFRAERQILANLEHPGIARLLDGGTSEGIPYLVMEYVEGVPITEYARERSLSIAARLGLMQNVCAAVSYAHRNLVIHRDLKPANIMVAADGSVKLLDFGLAKLTDPTSADAALTSRMIMTPEYASPEQIQGGPVTTATDVYSLGVILYELLTGERPYRITSSNLRDLERTVCHTEPRKPSTVEHLPARTRRRLAGDLDNIVLMALQKEPSRRYGSVEQLAEDIRRHLQGLPVRARPETLVYRGGKFLRRHRTAAAGAFVVAASLITGTVIAAREARAARERFDQLREFVRTVLVDLHGQLTDIPGAAKARQALVDDVDDYLKRVVAQHAGDEAALATEFATTYLRLGEMQGATAEAISSFQKGRLLLERKRQGEPFTPADTLVMARLRMRAGAALVDLGRVPEGVQNLTAAIGLADGLIRPNQWNADAEMVRAFAYWRLASVYRTEYRLPEAGEQARKAIAVGEEIQRHGEAGQDAYQVLNQARHIYGGVLRRQGHWQQAMEIYRQALADTDHRAAANPGSAGLQRELARCHELVAVMVEFLPNHDENELRFHLRSSIAIATRLAEADPSDKLALSELGQYLTDGAELLGKPDETSEAIGYLRRALPIFRTLLETQPDDNNLLLYVALTEANLGQHLGLPRPSRDSVLWLRRAVADLTRLAAHDPKETVYQLEVIKVQRWLAANLARTGQGPEALALAQNGVVRAKATAGDVSASPDSWQELPRAYAAMADTCRMFGRRAEARQWYRSALDAWEQMRAKGVYFPESQPEIEEARKGAEIAGVRDASR